MIKRLMAVICAMVLMAHPAMAGVEFKGVDLGGVVVVVLNPSDSQITYYFNCDSATSGQSPQKGSGTVTINASISTTTGQVGNAISIPNSGYVYFSFPSSGGNYSSSLGTVGFYYHEPTRTNGFIHNGIWTAPKFNFYGTSFNSNHFFDYKSGGLTVSIETGTWYFVELSWDGVNNKCSARVNGGSWTEATGLTGSDPTVTSVAFGSNSGNGRACYIDQIIVSNVYQKDIYAVRNNTSF